MVKRFRIILNGLENGWVSKMAPDPTDPGHRLYIQRTLAGKRQRSELLMQRGLISNDEYGFTIFRH